MKKNNLFSERLIKAIQECGKSANRIERELGYSRNALHNYRKGAEPSATRLIELARYFEVSPEYLIGKKNNPNPLSLTTFFQQLSKEEKLEILKISQTWSYEQIVTHKIKDN